MQHAINAMKSYISLWCLMMAFASQAQNYWGTPFEADSTYSAHYHEAMNFYHQLDSAFPEVKVLTFDTIDVGIPLHAVIVNTGQTFHPDEVHQSGKAILMVMNGIHPGESCGVDASMMWVRDVLQNPEKRSLLDSVVLAVIPMYNIGGALQRTCCFRANQSGPVLQGFRGNAKNLDLNRDFAKTDSRNMKAFTRLFHQWRPHYFVDTHTSNGADYQHVMTLIATQKDKLHPLLSPYLTQQLQPALFAAMEEAGFPMSPYVMPYDRTPDAGLVAFLETPRYSTGYTALFNTIGFVTEAHMFKPFHQRVWATYHFLMSLLNEASADAETIIALQQEADKAVARQQVFPLQWRLDTTKFVHIPFQGYEATEVISDVTGHPRLYYDRAKPWEDSIRWYNTYQVSDSATAPWAYIIPQAWQRAVQLLRSNGVQLIPLEEAVRLEVEVDYITSYQSTSFPWEGHYFHRKVETRKDTMQLVYRAGDFVVIVNQPQNRYIVEMLEPTAVDSWFRWNFFDPILMQKEYFSSYVFDATAQTLITQDPTLGEALQQAVAKDSTLANSHYRQLDFIYKRSPFYESTHRRYPVGRLHKKVTLPLE